jgi:thiol-disulfide isomerase/thioredoxin
VISAKIAAVLLLTMGQQVGTIAPEFKLKDLAGREFNSSQFRGSVVVLDLWATWCEPCIEEVPMFNRLHEKYAARGVHVIAIGVQSGTAQDIQRHVARLGIKYLVLAGDDDVAGQYLTVGFPTTYLIRPDGTIVKRYIGTVFEDVQETKEVDLEHEIDRLLQSR